MSANKLTVELLTDVANLGRKWAIINVSSSQVRNSLIPKGIVREITPDRIKKIEVDKKRERDKSRERLEKAFDIQKMLEGQSLDFTLKGKNGKLFGGLSEHEIGTRIKQKWGIDFEKHDIKLPNKTHIKTTGTHLVYLHITRDTQAKIVVEVSIQD